MPVVTIYEVFKKVLRERGESEALQVAGQMQCGTVGIIFRRSLDKSFIFSSTAYVGGVNFQPAREISLPHLLGLIGGALCIAFASIFAVLSGRIGGVGMWDAAFWRVLIGAVAIGIFLLPARSWRGAFPSSRASRLYGWLWIPGVLFAGDMLVWHWSFDHTSVANSTLLANVSLLFVTLFAWLVWKEKITRRFTGGAALAVLGVVALVFSSSHRSPPTDGDPVFGDLLALATACFYASYQLTMKYFRRERSAPVLMFWTSAVAAVCLFPVAWFHGDPFWPDRAAGWWPLIGLGVVSHACGQGLIAYGLGGVPASLAAVALLVQPVATAILGRLILGQELVPVQIAGGTAVIAGLFVAIRAQWPDGETRRSGRRKQAGEGEDAPVEE